MSKKKDQHLVPACYLRNFEADVSEQLKDNPKFESGIYINNKRLSSKWELKHVKNTSLTKPYFYNLSEDDPEQPIIENYLSRIETYYASFIKEIFEEKVNNENMLFLSYFVTLQYMRVEPFINSFKAAFDKIAEWMNKFEGKNNYENALKDISKRQLVIPNLDILPLIREHSAILYNKTNFPFLTSDNPVVRRQINITDALKIIPKRYLLEIENGSLEFCFFFLPLSPNVAYVSCELIKSSDKLFYLECDLENIFYLNYFSIINSHEKVYSSIIEPIKGEQQLSEYLAAKDKNSTIVKIYTCSLRILCNGSIENNTNFIVLLKLDDLQQIKLIKNGEKIKLFEVIENGVSIRSMGNCKVSSIDYKNGLVTIASNINFDSL